ncbi:sensor histidine kinase [Hahella ganghwensis]|uniref:sensor histidine kinase n=1 Tax=Hahella ganghwensis TaxID=286420 RepID=UPI000378B313|nr:HAMP domain-containing sensor histidine kinase [Hahella ganghwensis]
MIQHFIDYQSAIFDRLIPDSSLMDTEDRARARLIAGIIVYGAVCALVMGFVRLSSLGLVPSTLITFALVPVFGVFLVILWRSGNLGLTSDLLVGVVTLVLFGIAVTDGGVFSRVLVWMPAVPLLANFVGARLRALRATLLITVGLLLLLVMHYQEALEYQWRDGVIVGRVMATVFSMLFVSAICYQYESARRRAVSEYKAMEVERRNWTSMVAHELRTPLTAIFGALSLLQKQIDVIDGNHEQIELRPTRELIAMGKRNSERLMRLVNDILDLERMQSGNLPLHKSCFQLDQLILETCAFCAKMAEEKGLEIVTRIDPGLKATLDEDRIFQVLLNLISNAIKFSSKDGQIEVSAIRLEDSVRVTVRDYGSGIPENFVSYIFTPFAQALQGETRQSGGSGLGLYISLRIIEAHGGSLSFRNEDVGCRFFFDLPVC